MSSGSNETSVPAQQRARGHHERAPARAGQYPARRRQKEPVAWSELRPICLAAQHRQLVPKQHDLRLLEALRPRAQEQELQQAAERRSRASETTATSRDQRDGPPTLRTRREFQGPNRVNVPAARPADAGSRARGAAPTARHLSHASRDGYEEGRRAERAQRGRGMRRPCRRYSQSSLQREATEISALFIETCNRTSASQEELALRVELCSPELSSPRAPEGAFGGLRAFGRNPGGRASSEQPTPFRAQKKRLGLLLPAPEQLADPVHEAHAASLCIWGAQSRFTRRGCAVGWGPPRRFRRAMLGAGQQTSRRRRAVAPAV
jgi:hypothetical protein